GLCKIICKFFFVTAPVIVHICTQLVERFINKINLCRRVDNCPERNSFHYSKGARGGRPWFNKLKRSEVGTKADFAKRILAGDRRRSLPQVLEAQQHGERPFELAVEMDLVATQPLKLVWIERLAKRLLTDQRPVCQFLLSGLERWQYLLFE